MTALRQQTMNKVETMPEEQVSKVWNFIIQIEQEKPEKNVSCRIGAGKGKFNLPDDFDDYNEEIYAEVERYALS